MAYLTASKTWTNEILYPADLNAEVARLYHGFDGSLANDITCAGDFVGNKVMVAFCLPFTAAVTSTPTTTPIEEILIPFNMTISLVKIHADTAPTDADLIVDVYKATGDSGVGTSIFPTQANRPTIIDGGNTATSGPPDVVAVTAGNRLSWAVAQVGSTIAGGNYLTCTIYGQTSV